MPPKRSRPGDTTERPLLDEEDEPYAKTKEREQFRVPTEPAVSHEIKRDPLIDTSVSGYTIRPKKGHIRGHSGKCGLSQWADHALANVA